MSKKSRYRNFKEKAGTLLHHVGGKACTRLPPKAGTGLPLWEKAGTQPEPDRESCRQVKEYQPGGWSRCPPPRLNNVQKNFTFPSRWLPLVVTCDENPANRWKNVIDAEPPCSRRFCWQQAMLGLLVDIGAVPCTRWSGSCMLPGKNRLCSSALV